MHKCILSIILLKYFHHSVTFLLIGPLVQRASLYLHTDDSSSFAVSNFLIITAWNLGTKGQYLSLPHTHERLSTHHARWPVHTNETGSGESGKRANWSRCAAEMIGIKFCTSCYSTLRCHFPSMRSSIFLIIAACKEKPPAPISPRSL